MNRHTPQISAFCSGVIQVMHVYSNARSLELNLQSMFNDQRSLVCNTKIKNWSLKLNEAFG